MFSDRNYEVLTYDNPLACPIFTEAHGACFPESGCPDIIISDYDMPEVNGVKFVERLFEKGCQCRHIALLSGVLIPDKDMRRLAKYGTRFFTKPLDYAEVEAWLMLRDRSYS